MIHCLFRKLSGHPLTGLMIALAVLTVNVFATQAVLAAETSGGGTETSTVLIISALLFLSMGALKFLLQRHLVRAHASTRQGDGGGGVERLDASLHPSSS